MEFLGILVVSLVLYFFVLARKVQLSFKREKISVSYLFSLLLSGYIFYVHLKIAFENKDQKGFAFFTLKQFFLKFDVPLIMLVEVVKNAIEENESSAVRENELVPKWFKNRNERNEYTDILENAVIA